MSLIRTCDDILIQLAALVDDIEESDYSKASASLGNSTIGQHLRHTLEYFICLEEGFYSGVINYDKRNHDKGIETNKAIAKSTIARIRLFMNQMDLAKSMRLEVNYNRLEDQNEVMETTSSRELVYNIEHAVHHMALIKIGVREIAPYIILDKKFGIAASTIRYQENNAVVTR